MLVIRYNPQIDATFFSAEGDVLHQTLDCIFLGPYARIDYWPLPSCLPGEDCVDGPYWARDSAAGQSRSVDPYTCVDVPSLPYTCGSPARQSLVRYFVNTLIDASASNSDTSVFKAAVDDQLRTIRSLFTVPFSNYTCGKKGCTDFFPDSMAYNDEQIAASAVLSALDASFDQVYTQALEKPLAWIQYLAEVSPITGYDCTLT